MALVGSIGLRGVAIGTAVPVALVALGTLFPTACHRVGLGLGEVLRYAVWPALWPAAISLTGLALISTQLPATLIAVALQLALSAIVYFALFLAAVGSEGRREYLRHVDGLLRRRSRPVHEADRHGECFLTRLSVRTAEEETEPCTSASISSVVDLSH